MIKIISLVWLAIILAAFGGSSGCSRAVEKAVEYFSPRVTAVELALTDLTWQDFTINTKVTVENANKTGAHIRALDFTVYYLGASGWEELARGALAQGQQVGPEGSLQIDVPIVTKNLSVLGALVSFVGDRGKIALRMEGEGQAAVGPINFALPVKQELTLSVTLPPFPALPPLPPPLPLLPPLPPPFPPLPPLPPLVAATPTPRPGETPTTTIEVTIKVTAIFPLPQFAFDPSVITVKAGKPYIIRFSGREPGPHTFTADKWGINLLVPPPGGSINSNPFTEIQPGQYQCYDKLSSAKCTIKVEP